MPAIQGFFTDYQHAKWLDQLFKGAAPSTPAAIYVGLSTLAARRDGYRSEPSAGAGYARVALTSADWNAAANASTSNLNAVTFPAPTADWGTVTSMFLADAPTGGNTIAAADLAGAKTIKGGDPASTFAPGAISISRS